MKKYGSNLFQVGEVTKILGVTRKTLLVYEEMGLLTPAVKDEESGYRYYSADNLTQIRFIRSLQALGLSLKEVFDYCYDMENIDLHLQRLMELRASLDRNIQMLQLRATKQGDLTVHRTYLPRQVCFCRSFPYETVVEATRQLRETYIAATRTGKMDLDNRFFSSRIMLPQGKSEFLCCIPVTDSFDGPERRDFPESPALCIYYRGPYEKMIFAVQALLAYVQEHHIEVTGPVRSIYMEGPPNRAHSEDFITQVAVPIKSI